MVTTRLHAVRQVDTASAEKGMLHSSASYRDSSTLPSRDLRVPAAVIETFVHLHGAELKVLLVLGRQQARGGGKDQKPFPYSILELCQATGLSPRAISQAIERLEKHGLIQRVEKRGALPNRYWVILEEAAPQKIAKAKKRVLPFRHPAPAPEQASLPQKRAGRRRRKASHQLRDVEPPDLFAGLPMDDNQPGQA
jgi:DNA-binding MarR family transcriptional regulator